MTSRKRLAVLLLLPLLAVTAACGSSGADKPKAAKGQCSYATADPRGVTKKVSKPPSNPPKDLATELTIATDRGDIKVSLDSDKAPCTVNSFVSLAKQGYFDGTKCHRLTTEGLFVLQCGDPTASGTGGPGYEYADELVDNDPRLQPCLGQVDPQSGKEVCTYTTGTLAMANAGPGTNGSQFFLVYQDSPLPAAYTVFGRMIAAGLKVVRTVAAGGVVPGTEEPKIPVTITAVK